MDVDAMEAAVRARLGVSADDPIFTDTVLDAFINSALQKLTSEEDWDWNEKTETITTSASADTEAVAADYMRTIGVYEADGGSLDEVTFERIQQLTTAESANVRFFVVTGGVLHLRPVPNGVFSLTHHYVSSEASLSTGTDTPALPTQYHDALCDYATYQCFKRVGNPQEGAVFEAQYKDWLGTMRRRGDRYADTEGGGVVAAAPEAAPAQ